MRTGKCKPDTVLDSGLLRDADDGRAYICDFCHDVDDLVDEESARHFTSWEDVSALLGGRSLSWSGGPGEPGDQADGLTCIDCHTEHSPCPWGSPCGRALRLPTTKQDFLHEFVGGNRGVEGFGRIFRGR